MSEVRPIPGWPGYAATSDGEIIGRRGVPLKPFQRPDGYLNVALFDGVAKVARQVHPLVCAAFHGPKSSPDLEDAHADADRANNRPDNLRWATRAENLAERRILSGEDHPRALLSLAQVTAIRDRYADAPRRRYVQRGFRAALAAEFGVGVHVIKDIILGRSWKASP